MFEFEGCSTHKNIVIWIVWMCILSSHVAIHNVVCLFLDVNVVAAAAAVSVPWQKKSDDSYIGPYMYKNKYTGNIP